MIDHRAFQVGGHRFTLAFPHGMLSEKELKPYAPFQTDSYYGEEYLSVYGDTDRSARDTAHLFTLTLISEHKAWESKGSLMANLEDENGKMTILSLEDGGLTFCLSAISGKECCRLCVSKDYRTAKAWIGGAADERRYAFDTALMLLYTFASSKHDTLVLHASVVEYEGRGYLFLGKSGTGKSTHSRLWIEHVKGSELLNDDNPILRIIDGKVYVYGSPWSGKTPCYRNHKVPVGGIVRLRQGEQNTITPLKCIKAYAALQPSCSYMKWDKGMADAVHGIISRIVEIVPVYGLKCRPDAEAALICKSVLN